MASLLTEDSAAGGYGVNSIVLLLVPHRSTHRMPGLAFESTAFDDILGDLQDLSRV